MSILRIFGYDANIATFEQKVGTDSLDIEGSTCDIDVQCRSIHWTTSRRVTLFVIAFLAAGISATGGTLYAVGVLSFSTSMGIMAAGAGVLIVDLAVMLHLRKKHARLLEYVGEYFKRECRSDSRDWDDFPGLLQISAKLEVGKAEIVEDRTRLYALYYRKGEFRYTLEVYQTQALFNQRVQCLKDRQSFQKEEDSYFQQ